MIVSILLDRSGSMQSNWVEAIGAVNAYAKNLPARTKIRLSVFDHEYEKIRDTTKGKWVDVGVSEIQPRGMTALYDSAYKIMIDAEKDKDNKKILVVMTDGEENSSKEITKIKLFEKIKEWETNGWEVIFLGANFDKVQDVASGLGLANNKYMNTTTGNYMRSINTLSASTMAYATSDRSIDITAHDKLNAEGKL